jgi:hypothetical protein
MTKANPNAKIIAGRFRFIRIILFQNPCSILPEPAAARCVRFAYREANAREKCVNGEIQSHLGAWFLAAED